MENILTQLGANQSPDKIVARDATVTLTLQMLSTSSALLANQLIKQNIQVLAFRADNSVNWLLIDIACQLASICLIPLPTFFSNSQLQHVLKSAPVEAIITDSVDLFSDILQEMDGITATTHSIPIQGYDLLLLSQASSASLLPDNTGKITFTSGSTGSPKGVCLSNQQLLMQANALVNAIDLNSPRHLCLLPLSTLLENVGGMYAPMLGGGEIIIPRLNEIGFTGSSTLNPKTLIQTISRYLPDSIILTPQLLVVLVSAAQSGWQPPKSLKFVAVGGGKVSPSLLQQAKLVGIPAYEGYGLSEGASVVSLNTHAHQKSDRCGRALPHLNIEIDKGEIVVSGNVMLGYLNEPESWGMQRLYTGDLGEIDADGYLQINGRKKNLLISSFGRNINPEWVESEFLAQPEISEFVVFGDDKPYCVALLTATHQDQNAETVQSSIDKTNSQLPDYAQIKKWSYFPQPLQNQTALLTSNDRPKRTAIIATHQQLIESLYSNNCR